MASRPPYIPPEFNRKPFSCPTCHGIADQSWYNLYVMPCVDGAFRLLPDEDLSIFYKNIDDSAERERVKSFIERAARGEVFIDVDRNNVYTYMLCNTAVSQCFSCKNVAIWLNGRVLWPLSHEAPPANADLPQDIRLDYEEAASILNLSPRGSAALLRLSLQKLLRHLGENGKDINADIASLVKKGLDVKVQRALDIVRVVGNNAVHPGQIDLRDDRATAERLFTLVNIVADSMISQPGQLQEMFNMLPESAKEQIQKRDAVAIAPQGEGSSV